jgi:hypothetical protein
MKPIRCSDRMCGADDCPNCHPENFSPAGRYYLDDDRDDRDEDEDEDED